MDNIHLRSFKPHYIHPSPVAKHNIPPIVYSVIKSVKEKCLVERQFHFDMNENEDGSVTSDNSKDGVWGRSFYRFYPL